MKIESIKIRNFKAIENADVESKGKNVYLVGGNAVGKTSFIEAVWYGITGKQKIPEITHDGAKKGLIEIDLGDFIARTKLKNGRRSEFEIENKTYNSEAEKFIKAPRSFMESKIGMINFDVNEFFSKSSLEQVRYFSKMMNVDFSNIDADIEEAVESRKFDKKRLSELKSKADYYDEKLADRNFLSVKALSVSIENNEKKKSRFGEVLDGIASREKYIEVCENEIRELRETISRHEADIVAGKEWTGKDENKPLSDEEEADLRKNRDEAELINENIRKAKECKEVDEAVEKIEASIEETNDYIDKKRAEKAKAISDAITVEGLSYHPGKECFMYEGRPFDRNQTNTASQLIIGMKIANMFLKELKILKVDASLIDKKEWEKVEEWARKEDINLFVELVDREATQLKISVDE